MSHHVCLMGLFLCIGWFMHKNYFWRLPKNLLRFHHFQLALYAAHVTAHYPEDKKFCFASLKIASAPVMLSLIIICTCDYC